MDSFFLYKQRGVIDMAKIVVVDDALFMRVMLKNILEQAGHTVVGEAANGAEAIKEYILKKPDIMLMDITMPVMDGLEGLRGLKVTEPDAKVIMCSAMGQKSMVIDALKYGAKDFIVKPFQEERVLEAISKALE